MYDCTVYSDHATCTCPCYKYNRLCKHSLCVAEISGILKEHLGYLARTSRSIPSRSGLVEPLKQAQGKKGGNHKNTWRPNRTSTGTTEASARLSHSHPFSEIHHNNIPLVVCFLRDETKATECRQCRMAFPRRQKNCALRYRAFPRREVDVSCTGHQASISKIYKEILLCEAKLHYKTFSLFPSLFHRDP